MPDQKEAKPLLDEISGCSHQPRQQLRSGVYHTSTDQRRKEPSDACPPVKPFAARRDYRPPSTPSQRLKPTLLGHSASHSERLFLPLSEPFSTEALGRGFVIAKCKRTGNAASGCLSPDVLETGGTAVPYSPHSADIGGAVCTLGEKPL
jgi:hypothetical protein